MTRALELAKRGRGLVEPNPMVGAVLVRHGHIVGEGWHEAYGEAHAEINAIHAAGTGSHGATLYVTLEPCAHFGKTPPCVDTVIAAGVAKVVAAMEDPFPEVSGKGFQKLKSAGIDVVVGVCEADARRLNRPFIKRLKTGLPYIHAKWAMTLDGRIATRTGESKWITGEAARSKVHHLRGLMDAIVVGPGTLIADDPLLTARPPGPRKPTRYVWTDGSRPLSAAFQLLKTLNDSAVFLAIEGESKHDYFNWENAGAYLAKGTMDEILRGMLPHTTNVMLEGGAGLLGRFLDAGMIDEMHCFIAPKIVGGKVAKEPFGGIGFDKLAECLKLTHTSVEQMGEDFYIHGYVEGTV